MGPVSLGGDAGPNPLKNMDKKRVEFPIPKGFTLPEGTGRGDEFDAVCTFRVKENGDICLTRLGDTTMPGYEKDKGHKPTYSGIVEQMQAAREPMMEEGAPAAPSY